MPLQLPEKGCLHCETETTTNVQVRCDECNSYICNGCHWCHEFQANHEIRVCDRCDAFYCRGCDEMDQCDDCAEVVCGKCSTLLSCKFCGGGLCEECATGCGRCGIVLCSRDAKFAVDCDTCRLSYCLVCLASGSKDPCVRCGHRPSKRMEQLVHLRLKSIYKAFKQQNSLRSPHSTPDLDHDPEDAESLLQAMAASKHVYPTRREPPALTTTSSSTAAAAPVRSTQIPKETAKAMATDYQQAKAKADAAAAALLAELEEEEEAVRTKKTKKKKKKARQQQAKKVEEEEEEDHRKSVDSIDAASLPYTHSDGDDDDDDDYDRGRQSEGEEDAKPPPRGPPLETAAPPSPEQVDPMQVELDELISEEDVEGLELFLAGIKGVPGKAMLRKNAKKAIKRFRCPTPPPQDIDRADEPPTPSRSPSPLLVSENSLLRIVSQSNNSKGAFECVLHLAHNIVGLIIGKGGQRIRDLMEESGTRIWIDQESVESKKPRLVFVNGERPNVSRAVGMIEDLVDRAPISPNSRQTTPLTDSGSNWVVKTSKAPSMPEDSVGVGSKKQAVNLRPRVSDRANEGRHKHILTCEARFVPLLIGRRGWTIKNIQDTTGAKVDIDQNVLPRQITITGHETEVEEAIHMVQDVLSYPHAQPLPEERLNGVTAAPTTTTKQDKKIPHSPQPRLATIQGKPTPPTPVCTVPNHVSPPEAHQKPTASPVPRKGVTRVYSPPSSLIMTGDVRSTVSASSSLSSTPEPSMSKGRNSLNGQRRPMSSPAGNRDLFSGVHANHPSVHSHDPSTQISAKSTMGLHVAPTSPFMHESDGFGGSPFPAPLGPHGAPDPVLLNPHHGPPSVSEHPYPGLHSTQNNGFGTGPPAFPATARTPNVPLGGMGPALWDEHGSPPNASMQNPTGSAIGSMQNPSGPAIGFPQPPFKAPTAADPLLMGTDNQERDDAKLIDNLFGGGDFFLTGLTGLTSNGGLWNHDGSGEQDASRFGWGEKDGS